MALWKDSTPAPAPSKEPAAPPREPAAAKDTEKPAMSSVTSFTSQEPPRRMSTRTEAKESLIAADLTIEGKIEGAGHVRLAGSFKGDVNVKGDLTIEQGAHLTGQVRAHSVIVAGELQGNIEGATKVELLESGVIAGDVKAGSLTVAAGSRMRGQVEFGWEEKPQKIGASAKGDGAAA
jgi:cytoskeletal protein CcmA (bactofilin family)